MPMSLFVTRDAGPKLRNRHHTIIYELSHHDEQNPIVAIMGDISR